MRNLKVLRINQGLSSINLAKQIGITYVYLSKIEMGHLDPSIELTRRICEIFSNPSDFGLLDKYPSTKNMKLYDFKKLSEDLGYFMDLSLLDNI